MFFISWFYILSSTGAMFALALLIVFALPPLRGEENSASLLYYRVGYFLNIPHTNKRRSKDASLLY